MNDALIDTDVLIDFLRGQQQATRLVLALDTCYVSSISVAELYAGVRNNKELPALRALLDDVSILAVDGAIAARAGELKAAFYPSHGLGLPDALIAATAKIQGLSLLTLNVKHFPMMVGLNAAYRK
jgi:predicted nucleic acid-binding protein